MVKMTLRLRRLAAYVAGWMNTNQHMLLLATRPTKRNSNDVVQTENVWWLFRLFAVKIYLTSMKCCSVLIFRLLMRPNDMGFLIKILGFLLLIFSPCSVIRLQTSKSNRSYITLKSVEPSISGKYVCEISADAPSFHTEIGSYFNSISILLID